MIAHQPTNSIGKVYNSYAYKNTFWNNHIHKSFELVTVFSGQLNATINGIDYVLNSGESALIPPYVAHSFESSGDDYTIITVFSEYYISLFSSMFLNKQPTNFKFVLDKDSMQYIFNKLLYVENISVNMLKLDDPDEVFIKSALTVAVGEFICKSSFIEKTQDNSLLFKIIKYIEENFSDEISLHSLCKELNYNYSYVSRAFNGAFGINFNKMLNQYRVEKSKLLIDTTNKTLSQIALESGFPSIRTFNRCFFTIEKCSPTEYRKSSTALKNKSQ
jgi:AraC-like DNA-binding protein